MEYKINNEEMESLISMDEINKLLFELEEETSILRKKPSDIEKITDLEKKQKEQLHFKWLNEIYVLPLQELANRISMKLNNSTVEFYGLESFSIIGRMMKIRDFLLTKGCTKDTFMHVVPKNEIEVNILLAARARGFQLGFEQNQTLDNQDRIFRARQYLDMMNQKDYEEYGRTR